MWVIVTLAAALLSGPVIPIVLDHVHSVREAAEHRLTATDLAGKSRWELDVMRNEIYARHGRRFDRSDLQHYFESQPWYKPQAFSPNDLSEVERANAEFIRQFD